MKTKRHVAQTIAKLKNPTAEEVAQAISDQPDSERYRQALEEATRQLEKPTASEDQGPWYGPTRSR